MIATLVFWIAIALVLVYLVADGFKRGMSILLLAAPRRQERDSIFWSMVLFWGGHEVWFLSAIVAFWSVLPMAAYLIHSNAWIYLGALCLAILLRIVARLLRYRWDALRTAFDLMLAGASLLASFTIGLFIGGPTIAPQLVGHPLAALISSLIGGIGLVTCDALLGAAWLIRRSQGTTKMFAREIVHAILLATIFIALLIAGFWAMQAVITSTATVSPMSVIVPVGGSGVLLVLAVAAIRIAWRIGGNAGLIVLCAPALVLLAMIGWNFWWLHGQATPPAENITISVGTLTPPKLPILLLLPFVIALYGVSVHRIRKALRARREQEASPSRAMQGRRPSAMQNALHLT